jgi:hypothetical protein
MENLNDFRIAHPDFELGRDALPRVLADRQVGPTKINYGRAVLPRRPNFSPTRFTEKQFVTPRF